MSEKDDYFLKRWGSYLLYDLQEMVVDDADMEGMDPILTQE